MTARLLLTLVMILLGVGLFVVARTLHLWGIRRRLTRPIDSVAPGLGAFQPGRPALLYFSAVHCAPCRTVIKPALQRLVKELGNRFQVLEVDAEDQTDAARYWNVLSVPTIFVLDPQGKPRHVHYGVVSPAVLRAELGNWLSPVTPG